MFSTFYIWQLEDANEEIEKLKRLLRKICQDYNHEWPNEDGLTKEYRLKILKQIQTYIDK